MENFERHAVVSCLYMHLLADIVHNNFRYGRSVPNIRKRGHFFCLLAGMLFEQKVSGWNSLWSSTNLVQKYLSGVVTCKFECIWMLLRSYFSISELFHVPLDVACLSYCLGDIKNIPATSHIIITHILCSFSCKQECKLSLGPMQYPFLHQHWQNGRDVAIDLRLG